MENEQPHITGYYTHASVLISLLALTAISIAVTGWHLGALTVAVALLIACIKAGTVITWFMHVRHESLFIKLMLAGVFIIFTLVIIITFIDYMLR